MQNPMYYVNYEITQPALTIFEPRDHEISEIKVGSSRTSNDRFGSSNAVKGSV